MGEAKRRRQAQQQQQERQRAFSMDTGEELAIRQAGTSPSRYLGRLWRSARAGAGEMTYTAEVPCNGCRECCWHPRVDLDPDEERPEDLAHLAVEHDDEGYFLKKREDGACVHLGEHGCTVYAHRPRACRIFDCRLGGLAGLVQPFDDQRRHRAPAWQFEIETSEDRAIALAALPFVGRALKGEPIGVSFDEMMKVVVRDLFEHLPAARQIISGLNALPPEQQARLFADANATMEKLVSQRTGKKLGQV